MDISIKGRILAMSHYCPSCKRILYNRRLKHCGCCGEGIPEALRFTPEEILERDQTIAALAEEPMVNRKGRTVAHCPSCERVLYSRRLTHCGFCGEGIPEALRFTPEEILELDREIAVLEKARQEKRDREEAEEKLRQSNTVYCGGVMGGGM
jgi:predicted nucleic acid-binding Zn ribbon protein